MAYTYMVFQRVPLFATYIVKAENIESGMHACMHAEQQTSCTSYIQCACMSTNIVLQKTYPDLDQVATPIADSIETYK